MKEQKKPEALADKKKLPNHYSIYSSLKNQLPFCVILIIENSN